MRMKRVIAFLVACFVLQCGIAQQQSFSALQQRTVVTPSPDAAAFGKYGNIPVSTYTGVPNINIPLYSISNRDINIPVSLSYHSSGITVEEDASWVGLGWTLNVGGVITRQIRGRNDLAALNDGFHQTSWYGLFPYHGYPYDPAVPDAPVSQSYITDVCEKDIDPEPDMFYFNFLGKSGSFILEKGQDINGSSLVGTPVSSEKIDIRYDKTINKWVITTTDGFKYFFGTKEIQETKRLPAPITFPGALGGPPIVVETYIRNEDEATWSSFYYYNSEDYNVTGWYLDKIVSPLGAEVNYIYDVYSSGFPCTVQNASRYGSVKNTITDDLDKVVEFNPTGTNGTSCWGDLIASKKSRSISQTFTAHIYLKEIQFSQGSIVFTKSAREDMRRVSFQTGNPFNGYLTCSIGYLEAESKGPQKMDGFAIKDAAGNVVKRFELDYSYFNNDYQGDQKYLYKRLKLLGVRECDNGTYCKPYHRFYYNESVALPSKYSHGTDFWGYYNGMDNNPTRVPYGSHLKANQDIIHVGDADRQPSAQHMTAGILNKIVYPTGGSTEMEFEPHDYYHFGNGAFQITDFENNNTLTTIKSLSSTGGTTTDLTDIFTLTETTKIVIERMLAFYPAITSSSPCCAPNPFSGIDGNGVQHDYHYSEFSPYIEIKRTSDNSVVSGHDLGEYQIFLNTCVSPCGSSNNGNHGAFYHASKDIVLPSGTYTMKLKQYHHFQSSVTIKKDVIKPRVVTQNSSGVFAKRAGGLRIKKITDRDAVTNITNVKRFDYTVSNETETRSTGRLMMFPMYHVIEGTSVASSNNPDDCSGSVFKLYGRSFSNVPLGTSASGSIVGYDAITVYEGENGENGKTVFTYKNQEESLAPNAEFIGMPNLTHTDNGLVLNESVYNAQGTLLKSTDNLYTRQLQKNIRALAFRQTFTGASISIGGATGDVSCWSHQANQIFDVISDRHALTKTTEKMYVAGSTPLQQVTDFTYDVQNHLQLVSEETKNSKQETIQKNYTYSTDASWIPAPMWQDNYLIIPVRQQVKKNNDVVMDQKVFYSQVGNAWLPEHDEQLYNNGSFETVNTYEYFSDGNAKEYISRDGVVNTFIWDYKKILPIAKVLNAKSDQAAYTSFEGDATGSGVSGGWTLNGQLITDYSLTGRKCFSGTATKAFGQAGNYIITAWGHLNENVTVNSSAGELLKTVSDWKLYQWSLTDVSSITVEGEYDELRVYPKGAQMTTFSYDPLVGMTSQVDPANRITYFEYDMFQRLSIVRDEQRQIMKTYCYQYGSQQNIIPCPGQTVFYNDEASDEFTRQNCPGGYLPQTVTYVVADGKYSSLISKQDANDKAAADIIANGQAYANANGSCTAITFYAKIVEENYNYIYNATLADIKVKFFQDAGCTIPISLTNVEVNYYVNCQGGNCTGSNDPITVTVNGSEMLIASQAMVYEEWFDSFQNIWDHNTYVYTLLPGVYIIAQ
jgi:hypothetical protein